MELNSLLSLICGTDAVLTLSFYEGAVPLDFSGSTSITFSVRKSFGDTKVINKALGAGAIALVGDGKGGQITVTINDTETGSIVPGTYIWSVEYAKGETRKEAGRGKIVIGPHFG